MQIKRANDMDFESTDVEKDFPGLYTSDNPKRSESDFSDDGIHDKHSKKELLGGNKRKDKKDKKDRGYATLEGESSVEDEETKNPLKSKSKTKSFKFSSKNRDKREKSREKDVRDKDSDKEKKKKDKEIEKDVDREKRKEKDKMKQKHKDRKKGKHGNSTLDIGEEEPIFGVSLHLAVERSRCHDSVKLPLVVRDCIDFLEEYGMLVEGLYKVPGNKSKVQHLKKLYNQREYVNMSEFEPTVATSLLLHFIKDLPEPVLESTDLISRFEQAASTKELGQRESQLAELSNQHLPDCNRVLLAWITLHLDHVTMSEKTTKMNAQTIAMTLSPTLQMSHRLLLALLFHCKALFPETRLTKYIPPLPGGSTLPEKVHSIISELAKQESLLSQIHMLMNAGFVNKSREEQLWEVQRMITQLKRKYKSVQKLKGSVKKSLNGVKLNDESILHLPENQINKVITKESKCIEVLETSKEEIQQRSIDNTNYSASLIMKDSINKPIKQFMDNSNTKTEFLSVTTKTSEENVKITESKNQEPINCIENDINKLREYFLYEELLNFQTSLKLRISHEQQEIERLTELLTENFSTRKSKVSISDKIINFTDTDMSMMIQLVNENQLLEKKLTALIHSIFEQKDASVELRVKLALHPHIMAKKTRKCL